MFYSESYFLKVVFIFQADITINHSEQFSTTNIINFDMNINSKNEIFMNGVPTFIMKFEKS